MSPIRAIGLLSGGLDSALAACLLRDQGIEVIGLHLRSPTACRSNVEEVACDLGIRLVVRDKGEEYLRLLRNPRYGYGKNMNPCVDCRIFMFQLGRPYLEEFDARFVFTGEVVGQRPMSQNRNNLDLIEHRSGLAGLIVRPLSAQLLPETEPERQGWVDRSKLEAISGRGRDRQIELARQLDLRHYESPGGGCLLTDANFSDKLRDLFVHTPESETRADDVELLRVGRHVRIHARLKVVLGRDREENARLRGFENASRWQVAPAGFRGPTALVCGPLDDSSLRHAARLIASHVKSVPPEATLQWREAGVERRARLADLMAAGAAGSMA